MRVVSFSRGGEARAPHMTILPLSLACFYKTDFHMYFIWLEHVINTGQAVLSHLNKKENTEKVDIIAGPREERSAPWETTSSFHTSRRPLPSGPLGRLGWQTWHCFPEYSHISLTRQPLWSCPAFARLDGSVLFVKNRKSTHHTQISANAGEAEPQWLSFWLHPSARRFICSATSNIQICLLFTFLIFRVYVL